jgi:transcriptional regulator with XRE-family HTH domain
MTSSPFDEIDAMALKFRRKLSVDMPSFGACVKLWREKAGLSRSELARLTGVSATHMGNVERDLSPSSKSGRTPLPSREMCDQLSRVLGVPRYLVYLAAYVPELLESEFRDLKTRRMVAIFEDLPEIRKDEALQYLEMIWKIASAQPPSEPRDLPEKGRISHLVEGRK